MMNQSSLSNSSYSRSFARKSFAGKKSTPIERKCPNGVFADRLIKIISSQPDEPLLIPETARDSGVNQENLGCNNFGGMANQKENHLPFPQAGNGGLSDSQTTSQESRKSVTGRHLRQINSDEMSSTPKKLDKDRANLKSKENPLLAKLNRDLNSPSANARCRALKALKSPTMSVYKNFDVPHEEQDIITAEEKASPIRPKSIQEVMKDVIVYVEVRTGEDNRTEGVKKVISQMGARVNNKLLRDTTHVVFKDGLQSTYNKAKKWNIPIVSILWIEECTKRKRLMPPDLFPISNVYRYENPELYDKIKRQKSMQPDAEDKRRRKLQKADAAVKQKTEERLKATTIRIPRKPKDKVDEILSEFHDKIMCTPEDTELPLNSKLMQMILDSPCTRANSAKKLAIRDDFNRLATNLNTSSEDHAKDVGVANVDDGDDDFVDDQLSRTMQVNAKRMLMYNELQGDTSKHSKQSVMIKETQGRRRSLITPSEPKTTAIRKKINEKNSRRTIAPSTAIEENIVAESQPDVISSSAKETTNPIRRSNRRRTMLLTPVQSSVNKDDGQSDVNTTTKKTSRRSMYTPKSIELTSLPEKSISPLPVKRATQKRLTDCISEVMDVLPTTEENTIDENNPEFIPKSNTVANNYHVDVDRTTLDEEPVVPKQDTLIDQYNKIVTFNSTKKPTSSTRRRTIFDISMDIIGQRIQNINNQTPKNKKSLQAQNDDDPILPVEAPVLTPKPLDEIAISCTSDLENGTSVRKKRKLFAPTDLILTPELAKPNRNNILSPSVAAIPTKTAKKTPKNDEFQKRDTIKKSKPQIASKPVSYLVDKVKGYEAEKLTNCSTIDFESLGAALTKPLAPVAKNAGPALNNETNHLPYLVYTNMHSPQIEVIKQAVIKLGGFQLETNVSDKTTHVVTLDVRRTLNILRGIIRGLWIVDFSWIVESLENGRWLHEEIYEIKNFSRAVEICRSERQAFGRSYKIDLYADSGPFYLSPLCSNKIPVSDLRELIKTCSGRIVESKRRAKYIIGEFCDKYEDKICLDPLWILDSISNNKIKKTYKYLIKNN